MDTFYAVSYLEKYWHFILHRLTAKLQLDTIFRIFLIYYGGESEYRRGTDDVLFTSVGCRSVRCFFWQPLALHDIFDMQLLMVSVFERQLKQCFLLLTKLSFLLKALFFISATVFTVLLTNPGTKLAFILLIFFRISLQ